MMDRLDEDGPVWSEAIPDEQSAEPVRPLDRPELFINRELGLLEFNRRVVAQAGDPSTPLLERLRFLTIGCTNLDEFFEVRVAGLRQQLELGVERRGPDGLFPGQTLKRVTALCHELVERQYRLLNEEILPELREEEIHLLLSRDWDQEVELWAEGFFDREVLPVLTPMALDPSHPFPAIVNKSLNFIVALSGDDDYGRSVEYAVVQAPRPLPRVLALPDRGDGIARFTTLSSLIRVHISRLFPGLVVEGCHPFRVTRDSNLWINEEEIDDLMEALEGKLPRRRYGNCVRLEVDHQCPDEVCHELLDHLDLGADSLFKVDGPVNLGRLGALIEMVDRPELRFPPLTPGLPTGVARHRDTFATLRERDILLHHPFQPFGLVIDLLKAAARDPLVLAIKITLYRVGSSSKLTDAIIEAAESGKEVTAVVELLARFDEAQNIDTATRLQEAGAKVVYGIVGFKAHAKMLLIVRRESEGLRRYVHLGTGNYHLRNTKTYTDFGLLTADPEVGEDVHELFQQLTGLGKAQRLRHLWQSPFTLHDHIIEMIGRETENARAGKPSRIRAKMNSLCEPKVIKALYKASQAGVPIDLVVRGACSLRPGIAGVSETIRVVSIIGRFLEHSRVFNFHAGGDEITYLSSADWMPRNFFRRVETAFPITNEAHRQRVITEGLEVYIADRRGSWRLQSDGSYLPPSTMDDAHSAQDELITRLAEGPS